MNFFEADSDKRTTELVEYITYIEEALPDFVINEPEIEFSETPKFDIQNNYTIPKMAKSDDDDIDEDLSDDEFDEDFDDDEFDEDEDIDEDDEFDEDFDEGEDDFEEEFVEEDFDSLDEEEDEEDLDDEDEAI
ncbi:MAG: hypothetical protein A2X61_05635 [Ignavibacteria bacterium GWB2_35_12]|nr:MAG: hypothetical protein A2X63_03885 [Ignavibacteria bacterium GWA2_35_8]OGU42236.1 MAG: hypothetical protein A2X61_05635 [Ignavibacteria bacterium GWB2_35_12]OGV20069.1 MAG: hypothetical protein A2475_04620 [Ignavibacteria bacterium RIFOXYC2_FULL_35_21]